MTHGWYHPITQCKMTAGFDDKKNLTALHIRISGQSILATVAPGRMQNGMDPATSPASTRVARRRRSATTCRTF